MATDSPKYQGGKKDDPHIVLPQPVTDPSLLDSVAGFISDVVPTSYTTVADRGDPILWIRFEQAEFEELSYLPDNDYEKPVAPPIFLVVGYTKGYQVWCISATGEAIEIMSSRHANTKVLRFLPSPYKVGRDDEDSYMDKRPLIALCEHSSPGAMPFVLSFVSLRTGEQVHHIKFKSQIMDVFCNKTSVVVTFLEKIAVLDAFTLREKFTINTCYMSPGIQCNPVALGARWLAFSEKTLIPSRKSSGGCGTEGVQSVKATVIQCARTLSKGIKELGETVANSITGSSTFKPSIVCPGSPQSGGPNDCYDKGVVTIVDLQSDSIEDRESSLPSEAIIAHFLAHSDAIVQLEFDKSGMLLLTADNKGNDFNVFRIHPHALGSPLASVHHMYTLHRGDTTASIQSMSFSADSRWVAGSSTRGTTHVFPITPYGGSINKRTHTRKRVVNKMSRYHRSAGLSNEERPRSPLPAVEGFGLKVYPYANPRHPPFSDPTIVHPLAQIRQPSVITSVVAAHSRGTMTRQRSSSSSDDLSYARIVTCFAAPRAHFNNAAPPEKKTTEHMFLMSSSGILFQYDLEPCPSSVVPSDEVCDDTPIELKATPKAQWNLNRNQNTEDVPYPLVERSLDYFMPNEAYTKSFSSESDSHWLSQVEIVTHAGPHRRLWMGPQFVFKTYTTAPGFPFLIENVQHIDIARTQPMNMPVTQNTVLIECGSANSRELSPPLNTYHATMDAIGGVGEMRLKEDLADAMMESPCVNEAGGHRVIVSMKPQVTPVAKVVNPLGTVVTIQSDAETEKEDFEEPVIHENCDEALFRPIVRSKPTVYTDGKPHTNPTDTMLVRSLDPNTEVAVKLLDKSKKNPANIATTKKETKHITKKTINCTTENKDSNKCTKVTEKKPTKKADESTTLFDISNQFDSFNLDSDKYSGFPDPPDDIDCGLVFDEEKDFENNFNFPYLDVKNEDKEMKSDMFEDASDCYDELYISMKKEVVEKNEENLAEEKITQAKPRKPKTKLGVRIPNKQFPVKNEEEMEPLIPKRSWSSVAATKPKDKDISEKENCDLLDLCDEKGMKKSLNSSIKNVKLIHIETPDDEDAAIEIIEPVLPEYRKNNWYSNVLDKSSDEEKLVDFSGETTESDDSGKLPENPTIVDEIITQNIVSAVTKSSKKKSKKKRK